MPSICAQSVDNLNDYYDFFDIYIIIVILARMWCNPSLSLDINLLPLIPSLDETTAAEYPISGNALRRLMNQAVGQSNLNAVIGAITLLFLKTEVPHLKNDFPIIHLSFLDKIFYLVGEISMSNKTQNSIIKLIRLAVSKWFGEASKQELQKILHTLKGELNIFEKSMQCVQDTGEKKLLITKILLMFESMLRSEKTKDGHFYEKFQDHANFIYGNQRSLFLLTILYEIQYLLTIYINKQVEMHSPDHIIAFIQKKLYNISAIRRFSVLIENVAFILRKLLIIKNNNPVTYEKYREFLLRIEEIIDRFFTRVKLTQNINYFPFHMKGNHFFSYLLNVFNPQAKKQYQLIHTWRATLAESMSESLPNQFREMIASHIEDAIFFLQLREKHDFLRSNNQVNDINEFPLIAEKIILRVIGHSQLRFKGIYLSLSIIQILEKGQGIPFYSNLNIIEKGIMFYYIHYYQGYSFFQSRKLSPNSNQNNTTINTFKHNLTNQDLIELIQFYLLEIQLGNFHAIELDQQYVCQNSVNIILYQSLIDLLHFRLLNSLSQYKRLEDTKDLYYLKTMHKYLIILVKAINSEYEVPYICRSCKQIGDGVICNECEYLCLGIQLHSSKNPFNICRDKYIYQEMIYKLRQKAKQAYHQISMEMQLHTVEWLYMVSAVLESMIPY